MNTTAQYNLLQYLNEEDSKHLVFFSDDFKSYTYCDLMKMSLTYYDIAQNSPLNFLAILEECPFHFFSKLLGNLLANKKTLILSSKLTSDAILQIKYEIPFESIINTIETPFQNLPSNPLPQIKSYEEPLIFLLTSGSSGHPKAVGLSINNILFSAMTFNEILKMNRGDKSKLTLSHHHIGGLMVYWRAFIAGGLLTKKTNQKYDFISLVPLQLRRFLNDIEETQKLQTAKAVLIGGAILEKDLLEDSSKRGIKIYETYGMTETTSLVLINGQKLPHMEVSLDSRNCFLVKGKSLAPGYYRNNKYYSLPLNQEGFYVTSDEGALLKNGRHVFLKRLDLLFKSAGELVNPIEIENALLEIDFIDRAVVVPIQHPKWQNATTLVYKINSNINKSDALIIEEIKDILKKRIHLHHLPRYYFKMNEEISRENKPNRSKLSLWAYNEYLKQKFPHTLISNKNCSNTKNSLFIFFHGFTEDSEDFYDLANLIKSKYDILLCDLPGHGKNAISDFYDQKSLMNELKDFLFIYSSQYTQVNFYGYSMGGRIALELYLNYDCKIHQLILESVSFGLENSKEKKERLTNDLNLFKSKEYNPKDFFMNWYKNPIFGSYLNHINIDQIVKKKQLHDFNEWQKSLEFFSPGLFPTYEENLKQFMQKPIPLIAVYGEEDLKYKSHSLKLEKELRSSIKLFEIKNAGHNPHKTKMHEIINILLNF